MLLGDLLEHHERVHSDRPAFSADGMEIAYGRLAEDVRRTASALLRLGVGRGDRVAVLSQSTREYVELLFAVPGSGGVFVPLNPLLIARELADLLTRSRPRLLLFAPEFESRVNDLRSSLPEEISCLCLGSARGGYPFFPEKGGSPDAVFVPDPVLSDRETALLVYTGGTGGRPTGVMLSHRNLLSAAASAAVELGLSRNDIFLSCTSLPFIAGTGRLLRFLYVGATVLLMNDFDPDQALRAIEHGKVTHVLLTPAMIARILSLPSADRYNLSTLRTLIYGGGSVPLGLLRQAIRFFRCGMVRSYGQVESAGVLTFLHPEEHSLDESIPSMRKLTSVGKEAVGIEVRVVDDAGRPVGPNEVGEVVARGENIFGGYFEDPESTAEVLREGWLHTGDVASMDEDGYVYLLDRMRDSLMVGGFPVYPGEIESVLAEHPDVMEAAVVGHPDDSLGEVPVAYVSLREGSRTGLQDLLAHCRENMAPFKVPREITIETKLPKNSAGKVLKAKLRERILARRYSPNTSAVKE